MQSFKRTAYVAVALVLVTVSVLSGLRPQPVDAATLSTRSIRMSRSAPSATNVIYRVGFTIPASVTVGSIVIDFCLNSPLLGESCTEAIPGFNSNFATLSTNNQSGTASITNLSVDTTNSDANTVILNRAAASATTGTVIFELGNGTANGFTNRNTAATFYARIYTYAATAPTHNEDAATGYVDSGGIALSTAAVINITARVQETLTFCVYPNGGACGGTPNITIGHDNGAGTIIIDSSIVDTASIDFSLSTNASGGAVVRMKGDTLKDSVTPTPNDINPAGTPAAVIGAGTEAFGLRFSTLGSLTANSPYDGAAGGTAATSNYGLVASGGGTNDVTSTFGAEIGFASGPVDNSISTLTFAARASNTTAAGVYTAAEQLIATGTF